MDPLSIAASCAGVSQLCVSIGGPLLAFIADVRNLDENISGLHRELVALGQVLDSVETSWRRLSFVTLAQVDPPGHLWNNFKASIDECAATLGQLQVELSVVQKSGFLDRTFFRRPIQQVRLNLKKKDIIRYKERIATHQSLMQTSMGMIAVCLLFQNQSSQIAVEAALKHFGAQLNQVELSLTRSDQREAGTGHHTQSRLFAASARNFLSNASSVAEDRSTTWGGSIASQPLTSEARETIRQWMLASSDDNEPDIQLSDSSEPSDPQLSFARNGNETAVDNAKTPPSIQREAEGHGELGQRDLLARLSGGDDPPTNDPMPRSTLDASPEPPLEITHQGPHSSDPTLVDSHNESLANATSKTLHADRATLRDPTSASNSEAKACTNVDVARETCGDNATSLSVSAGDPVLCTSLVDLSDVGAKLARKLHQLAMTTGKVTDQMSRHAMHIAMFSTGLRHFAILFDQHGDLLGLEGLEKAAALKERCLDIFKDFNRIASQIEENCPDNAGQSGRPTLMLTAERIKFSIHHEPRMRSLLTDFERLKSTLDLLTGTMILAVSTADAKRASNGAQSCPAAEGRQRPFSKIPGQAMVTCS